MRIILDTDLKDLAGDDFALTFAIKSGRADLAGVTTVRGNVGYGAKVAKKYLDLGGYGDVPVLTGSENFFDGSPPENSYCIKGVLTTEEGLDEPSVYGVQNGAPEFIVDSIRSKDAMIVATGPLTNVARAIGLYPQLAGLTEIIVADYNAASDPSASRAVLRSGMPVTVVPSDVRGLNFTDNELEFSDVDELMKYVSCKLGFNRHFFNGHHLEGINSASLVSDPLAVAAALHPELLESGDGKVVFERPATEDPKDGYKVRLVRDLDVQGFKRDFLGALSRKPQDIYRDEKADVRNRARAAIALGMPNEALGFFEESGKSMHPEFYIAAAERFLPQAAFGEMVKWYSKLLSTGVFADRARINQRLRSIGDKLVLRGFPEDATVCYQLTK